MLYCIKKFTTLKHLGMRPYSKSSILLADKGKGRATQEVLDQIARDEEANRLNRSMIEEEQNEESLLYQQRLAADEQFARQLEKEEMESFYKSDPIEPYFDSDKELESFLKESLSLPSSSSYSHTDITQGRLYPRVMVDSVQEQKDEFQSVLNKAYELQFNDPSTTTDILQELKDSSE